MSALGSLVVKLALEYAQYTGGLDKSEQATLASLKRIQGAADQFSNTVGDKLKTGVQAGLGALAAFFAAGNLVSQVRATADELDRLSDVAASIGIATQSLAELGFAANQSGTDAQTLEGAMGKLNLKISDAVSGNKDAVKLFGELGVKLTDTNGKVRSTDAVMAELSDTFKDLPEGPIKSALAVELFGKSGAGLLQFLSQGSEGIAELRAEFVALSGGDIDKAAEQAGAFNDQLDKLSVKGQAAVITFGSQLLPTLTEVASMFTATGKDAMDLGGGMDFAAMAGKSLRTLLEFVLLLGSDVAFVLKGIGTEIGGIAAQAAALSKGDFQAAGAIRDAMLADAAEARAKLDEFQRRVTNPGQTQSGPTASADDARELRRNEQKARDQAAASARAAAALAKENTSAKGLADTYDKLVESIRARLAQADQQLKLGRDLTEAEKFEAKAKEDLGKIAAKLSGDKIAATEREIATVKARIEQVEIERKIEKELTALAQDRQRVRNADADSVTAWLAAQEEAAATTLKGIADRLTGLRDEEAAVAISRASNISLAEAIEQVAIARLKEKQERVYEGSDEFERLRKEIEARQQLLGLLGKKDLREREERGWTDMWQSVDSTAHDVFTNVFEGGSDVFKRLGKTLEASVLDVLYQMTVRKWMISIGTSVFGEGFAAAAKAATGGGAGGGIMDLFSGVSNAKNAYSLYQGGLSSFTAPGSMYYNFATSSVGQSFGLSNAAPIIGNNISAYAPAGTQLTNPFTGSLGGSGGAGMGTMAGAATFAAAAAVVLNGLGAFRSERKVAGGISGTLGSGEITPWEEWREGGTLFDGPEYNTINLKAERDRQREYLKKQQAYNVDGATNYSSLASGILSNFENQYNEIIEATEKQSKVIQKAYDDMRKSAGDMAEALGLSSDKVRAFTTTLGGEKGLNFEGLKPEEQQAKLAEALGTANNEIAQQLIGTWEKFTTTVLSTTPTGYGHGEGSQVVETWETVATTTEGTRYVTSEYAKEGEKAIDTLTRLATSLATVQDLWADMRLDYEATGLAGANAASGIADAFGGLEALTQQLAGYIDNYYTDAEKRENLARRASDAFAGVGLNFSEDEILGASRPIVRGFVEAVLAEFGPSSPQYVTAVQQANALAGLYEPLGTAATAAAGVVSDAMKRLQSDSASLQIDLLRAQGNTAGADAGQRALDTAGLTAAEIAVYDYNAALRAQISALDAAAAAAAEQTSIRLGFERQLLELNGDTAGLRLLDIAGMDAANVALYDRVQALQTEQATAQAATAAAEQTAQQRYGLEGQLLQLQGNTVALRARELAALDPANRALQGQVWTLSDLQAAAQAAQRAEQDLAATRTRVAQERYGLETQLLQLQGNTVALRARELDLLDPSNRALQEQVWALEAQAKASQAAASASQQLRSAWQSLTDSLVGEVRRIRGEVATDAGMGQAYYQSQFAIATAQARAGDQSAYELLPSLSKSLLELAEVNATSLVELQRIRAQTAGSLMQTGTAVAASRGLSIPKFDVGTNYVQQDMFALIHKGETIIPDGFDPAAFVADMGLGTGGTASVVAAISALQRQVARLEGYLGGIQTNTGNTSKSSATSAAVLEDAQRGRRELRVKVVA